MTRPDLDVMETVARIQQALSIAAGWARTKGDSQNARDKIKAGLDACRSIKSRDVYIRELEGALEPFARIADQYEGNPEEEGVVGDAFPGSEVLYGRRRPNLGDFRRARTALRTGAAEVK